jgi:hypothetical protein
MVQLVDDQETIEKEVEREIGTTTTVGTKAAPGEIQLFGYQEVSVLVR